MSRKPVYVDRVTALRYLVAEFGIAAGYRRFKTARREGQYVDVRTASFAAVGRETLLLRVVGLAAMKYGPARAAAYVGGNR